MDELGQETVMLEIIYDPCMQLPSFNVQVNDVRESNVRKIIRNHMQLQLTGADVNFYMLHNGKKFNHEQICSGTLRVIPCLEGGKGGFGSMLRAIGAQIEKTTNREACRDLSGRRLRDINEEKRLKKWISEQAEREREAAEKKKRKLSKLQVEPKHEFVDPDYDKARTEMTEKVHDAVEEGLKNSNPTAEPCSSKCEDVSSKAKKKKIKGSLWIDDLEEFDDTDSDDSAAAEPQQKKVKVA